MAIKIHNRNKYYNYIEPILNKVLRKKYHDINPEIYFVYNLFDILRHSKAFGNSVKLMREYITVGEYGGLYLHYNEKILIFPNAVEKYYNNNEKYSNEQKETSIRLKVLIDCLHEIRHKYKFHNNPKWTNKYSHINASELDNYYDCPLEKDAQNFAISIVNNNKEYVSEFIGSNWHADLFY